MATYPLSAAPTALLARCTKVLARLFDWALFSRIMADGKTLYRREDGRLFVRDVEVCDPFLNVSCEHRKEIGEIVFALKTSHVVVTTILYMYTGNAIIEHEHEGVIISKTEILIASAFNTAGTTPIHYMAFGVLDSLFTVAMVHLRDTMSDPNWKFQIRGIPTGGFESEVVPLEVLATKGADDDADARPRPQAVARRQVDVDWSRSIIETSDGGRWRDVTISFGRDSGLTPKLAHQDRIDRCTDALVKLMRATPRRPQKKESCKSRLQLSIDSLTAREFEAAWRAACVKRRLSDPESRWGRPGRLNH